MLAKGDRLLLELPSCFKYPHVKLSQLDQAKCHGPTQGLVSYQTCMTHLRGLALKKSH